MMSQRRVCGVLGFFLRGNGSAASPEATIAASASTPRVAKPLRPDNSPALHVGRSFFLPFLATSACGLEPGVQGASSDATCVGAFIRVLRATLVGLNRSLATLPFFFSFQKVCCGNQASPRVALLR